MSDLKDLYQEVILDHNRRPRNFHKLEDANRKVEGYNPLCGDRLTLYLRLDGEKIEKIAFEGSGCAISKASASLMTSILQGKSKAQVEILFEKFHAMVTGGKSQTPLHADIGKLAVFSGVGEFPARVKCATLAWHTLKSALEGKEEIVSTEKEEFDGNARTD